MPAPVVEVRPFERCQFENSYYAYRWPLGLVRDLRQVARGIRERRRPPVPVGRDSRFVLGQLVRVKDPAAVRATLGEGDSLRGLRFTPEQWSYCGKVLRVERLVRRMLDDQRRMRPIHGTVALHGATCEGADRSGGCGRGCSLFFRDEWLEPAGPVTTPDAVPVTGPRVRVRVQTEILATLGPDALLDGLGLPAHQLHLAGSTQVVAQPVRDRIRRSWRRPRGEWFVLDGVRCDGSPLGRGAPCERNCPVLWHRSWLELPSPSVSGERG